LLTRSSGSPLATRSWLRSNRVCMTVAIRWSLV
jgi:hypothetical protein